MLHGLMRGEASMRSLARSVHLATGLECISVGYPSSSMVRRAVTQGERARPRNRGGSVICLGELAPYTKERI